MLYDYKFTVVNSPSANCALFNLNFRTTFVANSRSVWPTSKFVLKRNNNLIPFWGYFGFNDIEPMRLLKTLTIDDTCTRAVSSYVSGGQYDGLTTWLVRITAGDELYVLSDSVTLSTIYTIDDSSFIADPDFNNPYENRNSSMYLLSSFITNYPPMSSSSG